MNRKQIAAARQRLERCEQIDRDLIALRDALTHDGQVNANFTDWNTGRDLLPGILENVINAGIKSYITLLEEELASITLEDPPLRTQSYQDGDTHILIVPIPSGEGDDS